MRAGIVVFLGTNCENETKKACEIAGFETEFLSPDIVDISSFDLIVLAGGFSYGDHISSGRIAKFAPIIQSLKTFDGFILGICNGFQILCESGLLPGALVTNQNLKFISKNVTIRFGKHHLVMPVAHHQGCFYYEGYLPSYVKKFTYLNNPNGSKNNIAGLIDEKHNIMGLMPHPERAVEFYHVSLDGLVVFKKIKKILEKKYAEKVG